MTRSLKILLIEDQSFCCRHLLPALKEDGHEVTHVTSLREAFQHLSMDPFPFEAILSDYNLGGRDRGVEAWQACNAYHIKVPFIGSSSDMNGKNLRKGEFSWNHVAQHAEDPNFHPIPKKDDQWDTDPVRAKLRELFPV